MIDATTDRARGTLLGLVLGGVIPGPSARSGADESRLHIAFADALAKRSADGPAQLIAELTRVVASWGAESEPGDVGRFTSREAARRVCAGDPFSLAALSWSKESGSELRGAPAAIVFCDHPSLLREVPAMLASTTHGHPTAAATATLVADWTARAMSGQAPERWPQVAPAQTRGLAKRELGKTMRPLPRAVEAGGDREAMESLGEGWVSEEAAAMALAALLRHPARFEDVVSCAVDHDGDRVAVGRIAGGLAGAWLGASGLPRARVSDLAEREGLIRLADSLVAARIGLRGKS